MPQYKSIQKPLPSWHSLPQLPCYAPLFVNEQAKEKALKAAKLNRKNRLSYLSKTCMQEGPFIRVLKARHVFAEVQALNAILFHERLSSNDRKDVRARYDNDWELWGV